MNKKRCSSLFSIVPVLYHNRDTDESYRQGTAFFINYKNRLFAITASHCIDNNKKEDLFLGINPSSRTNYNLPLSSEIKISYADGKDLDVRIFEIDLVHILKNIRECASAVPTIYELLEEIKEKPLIKQLMRKYRSNPIKMVKKIKETRLYKTLTSNHQSKIMRALKASDTSLVDLGFLSVEDQQLRAGDICIASGYPIQLGYPEVDMNTGITTGWHFAYKDIYITYLGNTSIYGDYMFSYDEKEQLDGFSGGPVFNREKTKVIGVCSTIKTENGKHILVAVPMGPIIRELEYTVSSTPDSYDLMSDEMYMKMIPGMLGN